MFPSIFHNSRTIANKSFSTNTLVRFREIDSISKHFYKHKRSIESTAVTPPIPQMFTANQISPTTLHSEISFVKKKLSLISEKQINTGSVIPEKSSSEQAFDSEILKEVSTKGVVESINHPVESLINKSKLGSHVNFVSVSSSNNETGATGEFYTQSGSGYITSYSNAGHGNSQEEEGHDQLSKISDEISKVSGSDNDNDKDKDNLHISLDSINSSTHQSKVESHVNFVSVSSSNNEAEAIGATEAIGESDTRSDSGYTTSYSNEGNGNSLEEEDNDQLSRNYDEISKVSGSDKDKDNLDIILDSINSSTHQSKVESPVNLVSVSSSNNEAGATTAIGESDTRSDSGYTTSYSNAGHGNSLEEEDNDQLSRNYDEISKVSGSDKDKDNLDIILDSINSSTHQSKVESPVNLVSVSSSNNEAGATTAIGESDTRSDSGYTTSYSNEGHGNSLEEEDNDIISDEISNVSVSSSDNEAGAIGESDSKQNNPVEESLSLKSTLFLKISFLKLVLLLKKDKKVSSKDLEEVSKEDVVESVNSGSHEELNLNSDANPPTRSFSDEISNVSVASSDNEAGESDTRSGYTSDSNAGHGNILAKEDNDINFHQISKVSGSSSNNETGATGAIGKSDTQSGSGYITSYSNEGHGNSLEEEDNDIISDEISKVSGSDNDNDKDKDNLHISLDSINSSTHQSKVESHVNFVSVSSSNNEAEAIGATEAIGESDTRSDSGYTTSYSNEGNGNSLEEEDNDQLSRNYDEISKVSGSSSNNEAGAIGESDSKQNNPVEESLSLKSTLFLKISFLKLVLLLKKDKKVSSKDLEEVSKEDVVESVNSGSHEELNLNSDANPPTRSFSDEISNVSVASSDNEAGESDTRSGYTSDSNAGHGNILAKEDNDINFHQISKVSGSSSNNETGATGAIGKSDTQSGSGYITSYSNEGHGNSLEEEDNDQLSKISDEISKVSVSSSNNGTEATTAIGESDTRSGYTSYSNEGHGNSLEEEDNDQLSRNYDQISKVSVSSSNNETGATGEFYTQSDSGYTTSYSNEGHGNSLEEEDNDQLSRNSDEIFKVSGSSSNNETEATTAIGESDTRSGYTSDSNEGHGNSLEEEDNDQLSRNYDQISKVSVSSSNNETGATGEFYTQSDSGYTTSYSNEGNGNSLEEEDNDQLSRNSDEIFKVSGSSSNNETEATTAIGESDTRSGYTSDSNEGNGNSLEEEDNDQLSRNSDEIFKVSGSSSNNETEATTAIGESDTRSGYTSDSNEGHGNSLEEEDNDQLSRNYDQISKVSVSSSNNETGATGEFYTQSDSGYTTSYSNEGHGKDNDITSDESFVISGSHEELNLNSDANPPTRSFEKSLHPQISLRSTINSGLISLSLTKNNEGYATIDEDDEGYATIDEDANSDLNELISDDESKIDSSLIELFESVHKSRIISPIFYKNERFQSDPQIYTAEIFSPQKNNTLPLPLDNKLVAKNPALNDSPETGDNLKASDNVDSTQSVPSESLKGINREKISEFLIPYIILVIIIFTSSQGVTFMICYDKVMIALAVGVVGSVVSCFSAVIWISLLISEVMSDDLEGVDLNNSSQSEDLLVPNKAQDVLLEDKKDVSTFTDDINVVNVVNVVNSKNQEYDSLNQVN